MEIFSLNNMNGQFYEVGKSGSTSSQGRFNILHYLFCLFKKITFAHDLALRIYGILSPNIDGLTVTLCRHYLRKRRTLEESLRVDMLDRLIHISSQFSISTIKYPFRMMLSSHSGFRASI